MAESGGGGVLAKAAGVGLLGMLAALGKFADDCGRAGAKMASHADDVARFGAKGADGVADDVAKLGDDAVKRGDVPLHEPMRGGPGQVPIAQGDEAYRELVQTVVEESGYTALELWLEGGEGDTEGVDAPADALVGRHRPARVLWSFLPLSSDDLGAYLEEHSVMDLAGHERFVAGDLVLKPVFSGLPVDRTFGLRESLKVYVGYTAPSQDDHLLTWEAGPASIAVLLRSCLGYQQACLVLACGKLDLSAEASCAVAAKDLTVSLSRTPTVKAALRRAVAWREDAGRADMVFHVALVDDGKPRLLRSAMGGEHAAPN